MSATQPFASQIQVSPPAGLVATDLQALANEQASKVLPPIANIAALRALTAATIAAASVFVTGYYTTALNTTPDGGGGIFTYDSTDTTSADNGGTIIVDASGRRWKRSFFESYNLKQFGAVLDGITDDTVAVQSAITTAATNNVILRWSKIAKIGPVSSSSNNIKWTADPGATIQPIAATFVANNFLVSLTGNNVSISDLTIDGNQFAFAASPSQGFDLLQITGKSPALTNVTVKRSSNVGFTLSSNNTASYTGTTKGTFINCHFDDNAGLGMNGLTASYHGFVNCTFDRNGYGYQKTRSNYADTSHGFVAFGVALRFRSHHIEFIGCSARDNGRDGINVNQGSYAIKHLACLAYGNDDGGFTIAADNTSTGLPGEGESPYDIEYVDCEAYNNYSSGLAVYNAIHGLQVIGGRYYNNHRLAGNQAEASSYLNGVYVTGNSDSVNIDTRCYDDRQTRPITASSVSGNATVTATGWVAGMGLYYPKVAFYNAVGAFQGYGKIVSDSAGSVVVTTTAFNSVTLASIAAGWTISQAVQHNGVFVDNNTQSQINVEGFGHSSGPAGVVTGYNCFSGAFNNGQNIWLPKGIVDSTELLTNPSFQSGITGWTFSAPAGSSATFNTSAPLRGTGNLKLIGGTSAQNFGDASLITGAESYVDNSFVDFSMWAYAANAGDAQLLMFYGSGPFATVVVHPGGGWRLLRIGAFIPAGSGAFIARVLADTGKTVYFCNGKLRSVALATSNTEFAKPSRYLPF